MPDIAPLGGGAPAPSHPLPPAGDPQALGGARTEAWHCAGWSRELATGPIGRKLLGRHVVLFRDAAGAAHALGARCPHRGADLARGAVVNGCIQCPFHGWRFDGLGRCVRVPSQPETARISSAARVPSFPLREDDGTLWIWMGRGEMHGSEPPRQRAPLPDRFVRRLFFAPQLTEAPFLNVLENAFDKAHLPFIHTGSFGHDQNALVARQRITVDADAQGLRAEDDPDSPWHVEPKVPSGLVGWLGRLLGLRKPVSQYARFDVGGGVELYLEYPDGTYDFFVTRITPADEERTWLFVESARTRAPHAVGDWLQRRVIGKLLQEGKRETSVILGPGPGDSPSRVSVESDRVGLAVRRLYEQWAGSASARRLTTA
jgi:phenylpropionate dioxygenase-like ring-hydroxylating dioxygenase large terminal subunit